MVWQIHGTRISFDIDKNGLAIAGAAKQFCRQIAQTGVNTTKIDGLPAHWEIHRASEAYDIARLVGLDATSMTSYLDAEAARAAAEPISVIRYHQDAIGFTILLPERQFFYALDVVKILATGSSVWRYWIDIAFECFMPRIIAHRPELVCYEDWLAGRPYVSTKDDAFRFRLLPADSD